MSLDAVSATSNSSILALFKQRRDAVKGMEVAVQSGDMGTAQQDLAVVQQASQTIQSAVATSSSSADSNPYKTTMKADLSGLMSAVGSGDLTASQSALQKMQTDQHATTITPAVASPSASNDQGSPFLDNLNALLSAAMTGDTKGAQSAATALNSEVQTALGSTSSTESGTSSTATPQSAFMTDLQSLITAAQSGDSTASQKAAQSLAGDIQTALGGAAGPGGTIGTGGHHHHHHHAMVQSTSSSQPLLGGSSESTSTDSDGDSDGSASSAASNPTTASQTSSIAATTVMESASTDPDGDGDIGQGSTSAMSDINSTARNALKAYSLLMNFVNQSSGTSAEI